MNSYVSESAGKSDDPLQGTHTMTKEESMDDSNETEHLDDVPDGAGCTGIWEHLSDRREDDE